MPTNTNTNFKKIITYGCSFTNYSLGTYADILGCDYYVTNRGQSGAGNSYIKFCLLEDFKSGILNNFDLVVVQWSGFNRWNYKNKDKWLGMQGNIFNRNNKESIKAYKQVRSFYNIEYESEIQKNDMILVKCLMQSNNINHKILSYEKTRFDWIDIDNIAERYKGSYFFEGGADWIKQPFVDKHPTLKSHLKIAEQILPISRETKHFVNTKHFQIAREKIFKNYYLDFSNRNITTGS